MNRRIKLTNSVVEKLSFPTGATSKTGTPLKQFIYWDTELRGFGLRISADSKTKTYILQLRVKGSKKERNISIGRHNDPWRVDDARARVLTLKAAMLTGTDPIKEAEKKQAAAIKQEAQDKAHATTLRQVMEHYLVHRRTKHGPLREATKKGIRWHCDKKLTTWLDAPVAGITHTMCLEKFAELSKQSKLSANLTLTYLRALLNHARNMHATSDGSYPVLATNPVTFMLRIQKLNPTKPRRGRIPKDRIGAVWSLLQKRIVDAVKLDERTAAAWVSLILLTGARRTESGSLKWTDVDLDARTVTLRGDVVKNHAKLTLPLSTVLHDILSSQKVPPQADNAAARRRSRARSQEYVFPTAGRKREWIIDARGTMEAVSNVAGLHVSYHDLRRTAEDIAKTVKVDPDERRQLLNHMSGGDVHSTHYANDDDPEALRPAVEAMAQWVLEQQQIAEGANVLPFRGLPAKAG